MTTATLGNKFTINNLLGLEATDTVQLVREIERGFSFGTLERVRRATGLPLDRLAISIGISPRTLTRRKKNSKLNAWESDRLVSISRLLTAALELFEGDAEKTARWFNQPNRALGDVSPLEMAATETGAREVENLIGRLEHGVFS